MMQEIGMINVLAMQAITATTTGADVSTVGYIGHGGREIKVVSEVLPTGSDTDETATPKLQESETTVSSDFTDVTDGAFAAVAQEAGVTNETLHVQLKAGSQYVRGVVTLAGTTPAFTVSMKAFAVQRVV